MRITEPPPEATGKPDLREDKLALLDGVDFRDGTIELWLAGSVQEGAPVQARGFVGIAFRVAGDGSRFEAIYLRPRNGRDGDQLRRNHSIQYISFPEYPWQRLRKETPGVYESYTDLALDEWTHYKLVVKGGTARLFLRQNEQASLIVNDLKLGESSGGVALWIGPGTVARFTEPVIRRD